MRSTCEVLGISENFGEAYYKAQEATQTKIALSGTVLISINDGDKPEIIQVAKDFEELGFKIKATGGTYNLLAENGIKAEKIFKLQQGRPNILDAITNGEIDIIINTPDNKKGLEDDSYIRKSAIRKRVFYVTTVAAAKATVEGIKAVKSKGVNSVKSLQEFHSEIK